MLRRNLLATAAVAAALAFGAAAHAQGVPARTHVGVAPSGLVVLTANLAPGEITEAGIPVSGMLPAAFVLPPKTVSVLTDVYAEAIGTPGYRIVSVCETGVCSDAPIRLAFDSPERSRSLSLTSGMRFAAPPRVSLAGASAAGAAVRLFGYLAKDR